MSVKSQVKVAEEALRQALINALAEGEDQWIADLFASYQTVGDLNRKVNPTTFNVDRPGGDLDRMDNVIDFGTVGQFNVDTDYMTDLDFENINISTNPNGDDTITFS
tara:strand:- start:53 stop:373 length:321 start_codon:yes stop_codon:yes gene_type:complete